MIKLFFESFLEKIMGKAKKENNSSKSKKVFQYRRLENPKIIRDPIHDLIIIDSEAILAILDTAPFQRLKRIRQLGLASSVYPSAEHTRFAHSLGVYYLATRMLDQLKIENEYDRFLVQLSALLHDVGHGPFSHLFERVIKKTNPKNAKSHVYWSIKIITEDPEIKTILDKADKKLRGDIKSILSNSHDNKLLQSIVSSQMDADRFDYMLRDSYMTGVQYGKFDINWMLLNLKKGNVIEPNEDETETLETERIVVDGRRGLSTLQDYLVGLFNLYKHVYHHKTVLIAEGMLETILTLAIRLKAEKDYSESFNFPHKFVESILKSEELTLEEYLSLDDTVVSSWIQDWSKGDNVPEELKELSLNFLNRQFFKGFFVDLEGFELVEFMDKIRKVIEDDNLDPTIYLIKIDPKRMAYKNIFFIDKKNKKRQTNVQEEIYYLDKHNTVKMFSSNDEALSVAIMKMKFRELLVAFPEEYNDKIRMIYEGYK